MNALCPGHGKRATNIGAPLVARKPGLRSSFTYSRQRSCIQLDACGCPAAHKSFSYLFCLIEPAFTPLAFKQRDRHYQECWRQLSPGQSLVEQAAKQGRYRPYALIFQQVDQVPQNTIISAIGNRGLEWRRGAAARPTERTFFSLDILANQLFATNTAYQA